MMTRLEICGMRKELKGLGQLGEYQLLFSNIDVELHLFVR
jgi:hypothetical protein